MSLMSFFSYLIQSLCLKVIFLAFSNVQPTTACHCDSISKILLILSTSNKNMIYTLILKHLILYIRVGRPFEAHINLELIEFNI